MTLEELKSKCFTMPGHVASSKLFVFTDEYSADDWIEGESGYELTMVLQSDMVPSYTLKEEWCKAEVQHFYAVGEDELVVVVEEPGRKKGCDRKRYKKEPIVVGDEIIVYDEGVENGKFKATVIDIDCDGALWILDEAGANTVINPGDERKREKTGKHFDYIADLIYSMEECATE